MASRSNKKREAPIANVRILGIFAHVDAGKTTTSEAILYHTGRIHRAGRIDDGNTQLDWMDQERERGITIMSAATACHWRGHRINLIDTPGHIDFTAEVVRSIRVIDGAIIVLCGVGGVEPQTEAVWQHADREDLPRLIYINKLDRTGANFDQVLDDIREHLTSNIIPVQLPIGQEGTFQGVVDLLTQRALVWKDGAREGVYEALPDDMVSSVTQAREELIDSICETDDALLIQRLEGQEPTLEDLKTALRRATISRTLIPVLCGASRQHIGITPLLDAAVDYLPAPTDMRPVIGHRPDQPDEIIERPDDPTAPFCALAFKVMVDPYVGHLTWVRVFSGTVHVGDTLLNARTGDLERVGRIYRMHANHREQVETMAASDVVALVGIGSATTGDTLCDPKAPIALESLEFPEPVISIALTPASNDTRDRLHQAVRRLADEDPTLIHRLDPETGELTLSGMGELHLEVTVERLRREFELSPNVSPPQIAYRETVRRPSEGITTYRKQTGGHGHYARIRMQIAPLSDTSQSIIFEDRSPAANLPREFVRPVERGARAALEKGIVAGFPVTGVKVTLLDGDYHDVDSASQDFEVAGSIAVKELIRKAAPALLEPIMRLTINIPEEYLGSVIGDIGRRRGTVHTLRTRGNFRSVDAEVPLGEVRGYATDLRSLTQGRGTFSLRLKHYAMLPQPVAEEIIRARRQPGQKAAPQK